MSAARKTASVVLRTAFGLGLLVAVVVWLEPQRIFESLRSVRRAPLLAAFAVQLVAKLVWTYRWRSILSANGIDRGFGDLFVVTHIGLFFNTFLPTSMGGDVVRGYYASRGGKEQTVVSYLSLLIERVLGLATFAAMAAIAASVALATQSTPLARELLVAIIGAGLAIVLCAVIPFWWRGWAAFARKLPVPERWIESVSHGLELFRRPETPRLAILSSSVLLKLLAISTYLLCGEALGLDLAPTVYFLVVPAAVVAAMLPVTLNGLGVRESVLVGLLTVFGAPSATAGAMALLGLGIITSFALLGGLFYTFYRRPETP